MNKKQVFCVWLHNNTSKEDDQPVKVRATSKKEARKIAGDYDSMRFSVGNAYTIKEFSKETGWPHTWATLIN